MTNQKSSEQLLRLYEEFANFEGDCSFLCEAISTIVADEELLSTETALGIRRFSYSIKNQAKKLKQELHQIYKNSN